MSPPPCTTWGPIRSLEIGILELVYGKEVYWIPVVVAEVPNPLDQDKSLYTNLLAGKVQYAHQPTEREQRIILNGHINQLKLQCEVTRDKTPTDIRTPVSKQHPDIILEDLTPGVKGELWPKDLIQVSDAHVAMIRTIERSALYERSGLTKDEKWFYDIKMARWDKMSKTPRPNEPSEDDVREYFLDSPCVCDKTRFTLKSGLSAEGIEVITARNLRWSLNDFQNSPWDPVHKRLERCLEFQATNMSFQHAPQGLRQSLTATSALSGKACPYTDIRLEPKRTLNPLEKWRERCLPGKIEKDKFGFFLLPISPPIKTRAPHQVQWHRGGDQNDPGQPQWHYVPQQGINEQFYENDLKSYAKGFATVQRHRRPSGSPERALCCHSACG